MEGKTPTKIACSSVTGDLSPAVRFNEKLSQLPPEQARMFEELARYESEHINHNFSDKFDHLQLIPLRATPRRRVGNSRLG